MYWFLIHWGIYLDYIFILHLKILFPKKKKFYFHNWVGVHRIFFFVKVLILLFFLFIQPEINESYLDLEFVSYRSVWIASWPSGLH